jgi:hypothetical protein
MADDGPFGGEARQRFLKQYIEQHPEVTEHDAWEHVYHLLLSIDRRTRLAHIYDSNHMQAGRTFHKRAQTFTEALCAHWGTSRSQLPGHLDLMFQACVQEYLRRQEASAEQAAATQLTIAHFADSAGTTEAAETEQSKFALEITAILAKHFGAIRPDALAQVALEIERRAEHYFTIGNKRQNVRGEGFEDILEWLLLSVAHLSAGQVLKRQVATDLPGFKPGLKRKRKAKVPKPDLVLLSPARDVTLWLVTAKWSLRQDRLDQFGQEFAYYKANQLQPQSTDFVLLTNEMDLARLIDVLEPPPGAGSFHFDRVYHINRDFLEMTHGKDAFARQMRAYVDGAHPRLLSLKDFLEDTRTQLGAKRPRALRQGRAGER